MLEEISEQKELTEGELREQLQARIGAEKQLQAAEKVRERDEIITKEHIMLCLKQV